MEPQPCSFGGIASPGMGHHKVYSNEPKCERFEISVVLVLLGGCVGGEHNNRYLEIQQIPSLRGPGPWAELSLERCSSGETERQREGLLGSGVM